MSTPDVEQLASLLARVAPKPDDDPARSLLPEDEDPGVHQLVYSLLLWNSTHPAAAAGIAAIYAAYEDYNDLRADAPMKIAETLSGVKRPKSAPGPEELAVRLVDALTAVFHVSNVTSLASLSSQPKRDARACLDALPGTPRFVSARVALLEFGAHGVPLDDNTATALTKAGVLDSAVASDECCTRLERAVRAADAIGTHLALETWRSTGFQGLAAGRSKRGTAASKTSKGKAKNTPRARK